MARKRTLNYRELRSYDEDEGERRKEDEDVEDEEEDEDEDEEEAAEPEEEEGEAEGEEDEEEVVAKPPPKKKKAPPKPAKPKRSRAGKIVRVRVVWKVFNNSNQAVATFDYARKQEAEEHAAKLSAEKNKGTFFIQPVKEPIEEK
ncbi:MAG: hypothetical protein HYS12_22050 [Planctomycetes bacterium]|nr:hypothetical protein [Planctomycetota bacterium]